MTIEEIKSVSIYQWMIENDYGNGSKKGKNVFYCSPLRCEGTPSFVVNTKDNLWHDFGTGIGGNIINLVERLYPTWSEHQVLSFLERQIKDKKLAFNEDFNARIREAEKKRQWAEGKRMEYQERLNYETFVERITLLSHPALYDYLSQRKINIDVAKRLCKEVHYSVRGKRYYAIAFLNVVGGMEARNRLNKRCIGKKGISTIYANATPINRCCVFEGFFDMLSYVTMQSQMPDNGICISDISDYFVLNGVAEVKQLLPYLKTYDSIHCFLDNDEAGKTATKSIAQVYTDRVIDESYRYKDYNDVNDFLISIRH